MHLDNPLIAKGYFLTILENLYIKNNKNTVFTI